MESTDERRVGRLDRLLHATGFAVSFAVLEDLPEGQDAFTGWVGHVPYACISRRLPDPAAEARLLHEVAHWSLGHDGDFAYRAAAASDVDGERGPWEIEADALAAALVEDLESLMSDAAGSIAVICEDAARFR